MSVNDLVSILVPAFNCERWIGECLASAAGQTWCRTEVIVVDDGSTDGTLAAARAHASACVKVVTQENQGASAARNHAFSLAQGRYIQWLDADDVLAPDKIERQMTAARPQGDLTLHACPYGVFHYRIQKAKFNATSLWRDHTPICWALTNFTTPSWMIPAAWLVSRRLAEAGGQWDERLTLNDDGEYFCRVVLASKYVGFVQSATCYYRSTGYSQLSRSRSERAIESLLLSLSLCIEHLLAVEVSNRTRHASLALLEMYSPLWQNAPTVRERADRFAAELGGRLHGVSTDRKTALLADAVGPERATRWMDALRRLRLSARVRWDGVLHRWTP
jgi:glycosyltransferase involved in cell wall biosynthesis